MQTSAMEIICHAFCGPWLVHFGNKMKKNVSFRYIDESSLARAEYASASNKASSGIGHQAE